MQASESQPVVTLCLMGSLEICLQTLLGVMLRAGMGGSGMTRI